MVGGSAAAKTASLPAPPRCVCRCRVLGVSTAQLPPHPRARRRSQADGAKAASAGPACAGRKTSPRSRSGRPGSSRRRGREGSHWQPPWADETRDKGAWRWGLRPAPSASPSAPGIGPSLGSGVRAEPARTAPWTRLVGIREQMAPRVGRRPHDRPHSCCNHRHGSVGPHKNLRTCPMVVTMPDRKQSSCPPPSDASGPAACSRPYCRALPSLRAGVTPR